jgi:hypothetical protein
MTFLLDSPVNPSTILRTVSMSNGPGNDMSLCDNLKLALLKGERFQPSPIRTLISDIVFISITISMPLDEFIGLIIKTNWSKCLNCF